MPKLVILATCNDVTFDEGQTPSLYHVFIAMNAGSAEGQIPPNAVAPREWKVFAMWRPDDEKEIGKPFTQKVKIFTPDGTEYGSGSMDFKFIERSHYNKMNVSGMPIGVQGNVVVKVWLEVAGKAVTDIHIAEINIQHLKGARPVPPQGSLRFAK